MRASRARVRPSCIHLISVRYLGARGCGSFRGNSNAGIPCHAGCSQFASTGGSRGTRPISSGGSVLPIAIGFSSGGGPSPAFVTLRPAEIGGPMKLRGECPPRPNPLRPYLKLRGTPVDVQQLDGNGRFHRPAFRCHFRRSCNRHIAQEPRHAPRSGTRPMDLLRSPGLAQVRPRSCTATPTAPGPQPREPRAHPSPISGSCPRIEPALFLRVPAAALSTGDTRLTAVRGPRLQARPAPPQRLGSASRAEEQS